MRTVLFLDLDDTIFQTLPKCPPDQPVQPVASGRDGTPLSFMTRRQRTLLDLFLKTATVIPTTARNLEAFRRVELPFTSLAILNFGGVVLLPNGFLDPEWDDQIRPRALEVGETLHTVLCDVERCNEEWLLGLRARVITDFAMPLYLVVKHPHGDSAQLDPIEEHLRETMDRERFFLHRNHNNLSLVPRFLGKEVAVRHVIERHLGPDSILTLGMGDSLTDAPFLDECDFNITPRDSQLARWRGCGDPTSPP